MSSGNDVFAPVSAGERIVAMDMLRGFALFGIFMVNMEWFSRPFQEFGTGVPPGLSGIDHAVAWCVYTFMAGKFWILFSLLFGMGFALMLERASAAGRPFAGVYLRRISVLFVFGIAHALLLWVGDILHGYAIAALLLLLMRNLKPKTQLRIGVVGYLGLGLLTLAAALVVPANPPAPSADTVEAIAEMKSAAAAAAQTYASGDYAQVTAQRLSDFAFIATYDLVIVPSAVLIFLIGAWFVRSGKIRDVAANRAFFVRLALFALPVGLLLVLSSAAMGVSFPAEQSAGGPLLPMALMLLGSLPLSLGYLALVVLTLAGPASRLLSWLAPVGRMALTNYLLQSLLCTLIFYGYGLAMWGRIGYAGHALLAVAIFAAQVAFSRWWLARYRFGPMEWLWRWFTYGTRPPMRVA